MAKYLLAHDIGTSGDKATLFREDGTLIKSILGEYPSTYGKGGIAEQNPEDWWAAVCRTTKELLEEIDKKDVAAISFGGMMMGCTPVNDKGEALRSSIMWSDTRSQKQADELQAAYGWDAFYETTGHRISPSHTITKLMWIKENQPEIYKKTYKTLCSKDYIVLKLTGKFVTDYSDASGTLAYNINTKTWADDVIKSVGLDVDKFPEIRSGLEVVGTVTAKASMECGLPEGTPVVLGGGDGQMCAIGAGTSGDGDVTCNLGTSAFISFYLKEPIHDASKRIVTWNAADPNLVTTCGTMQALGASIAWMRDNLCQAEVMRARAEGVSRYKYINEASLRSPVGANGLLFLPYLQGERSPYWNGAAKGSFVGLTMKHNADDIKRAVFEGVAMN
ncbi:MAG: xylulokinase, partial [Christensenellaceae bacterium]|nr:xylulokinase [Christensenellaceae bacterium]